MLSRLCSFVVMFMLATPATMLSAQVGSGHTDVIFGRIQGPDGQPLAGVWVEARSVELQTSCTQVTGADGRYTIRFLDGGGQYGITARALGMSPGRQEVARLPDEDRLEADFKLVAARIVQDTSTMRTERAPGGGAPPSPHCS
jgi:hypothetical protein